jgi:peptidyl-prolyl cis-trans isomerase D
MLDAIRKGQRWLTALIVVGVGAVFAIYMGAGSPQRARSPNVVVQVGSYQIGIGEFERTRAQQEEQYRQVLGDQFDARAMRDSLDMVAARVLVERAILALEAERLGLTVTKQEVEREILSAPGFRGPDGSFDKLAFDRWVAYEFGSERAFRDQQRRAALASKLMRVIRAQAYVSDGEARDAVARRLESIRVAFTTLDTKRIPEDFARDEQAIEAFLAERAEDARKLYEERSDLYDVPEQTRARHILLQVGPDATDEEVAAVEERARAVLERLRAGEEFAVVAEETSEDPGSKANGGDLGFFRRGQMVGAFDEVAFSLEPGTLSEPVRSEYGFHLIRVEERKPAQQRSFEEVRGDLAFELLGQVAGREQAWAAAERLAEEVRGGKSLETAAREAELTLERSGWLRRRPDGFVPALGAAPELQAVAFTLEPGQSSDRIFAVGDKLALVQLLERQDADPEEVEKQLEEEREQLANQKLNRLTDVWVGQRRAQLADSGELIVNLEALGRRG